MPEIIKLTELATTYGIHLRYAKYGNVIMLAAIGTTTQALNVEAGAGIVLGIIPENLRPTNVAFFPINSMYANAQQLTLSVGKDGTVSIVSTGSAIAIAKGKYFNGVFMYITET